MHWDGGEDRWRLETGDLHGGRKTIPKMARMIWSMARVLPTTPRQRWAMMTVQEDQVTGN
jgi:hypothetical protein